MIRLSATDNLTAADRGVIDANAGHATGDGSDHADVATNTGDIAAGHGPGVHTDGVAGALVGGPTTINSWIAGQAGQVLTFYAKLGTGCAAGQTVTIDVQIAGVSCLTAPLVLDNAAGTTAQAGTIDAAADDLAAGNAVTVIWTEANGGGPTAADLTTTVGWRNV